MLVPITLTSFFQGPLEDLQANPCKMLAHLSRCDAGWACILLCNPLVLLSNSQSHKTSANSSSEHIEYILHYLHIFIAL